MTTRVVGLPTDHQVGDLLVINYVDERTTNTPIPVASGWTQGPFKSRQISGGYIVLGMHLKIHGSSESSVTLTFENFRPTYNDGNGCRMHSIRCGGGTLVAIPVGTFNGIDDNVGRTNPTDPPNNTSNLMTLSSVPSLPAIDPGYLVIWSAHLWNSNAAGSQAYQYIMAYIERKTNDVINNSRLYLFQGTAFGPVSEANWPYSVDYAWAYQQYSSGPPYPHWMIVGGIWAITVS